MTIKRDALSTAPALSNPRTKSMATKLAVPAINLPVKNLSSPSVNSTVAKDNSTDVDEAYKCSVWDYHKKKNNSDQPTLQSDGNGECKFSDSGSEDSSEYKKRFEFKRREIPGVKPKNSDDDAIKISSETEDSAELKKQEIESVHKSNKGDDDSIKTSTDSEDSVESKKERGR